MNADLKGALKQINNSYRAFEHKGKPMTKEQVKKVLEYGIEKGYEHTGRLTDKEVDMIIATDQDSTVTLQNNLIEQKKIQFKNQNHT